MPHKFKDNAEHEYTVSLTLGKVRAIRDRDGFDVFKNDDWQALCGSLSVQLGVVWFLVEDQAESFGQTLDSWELSLQGDGIATGAAAALFSELADFYRRYDQDELATMTDLNREHVARVRKQVARPEFVAAMNREVERLLNNGNMSPA